MKYRYYLKVFRLDHWFKNLFTLMGSLAALSYFNRELSWDLLSKILMGLLLACLVSSVNYAINEILDASYDLQHPVKRFRPIPSGLVDIQTLVILTLGLLLISLSLAFYFFNPYFQFSLIGLFLAGMIYNLRPLRAKEIPYIDVLSESLNNPIRFLIGWFSVISESLLPPLSLILWLWVFGAFLMTAKRLAELLFLGSQAVLYRRAYQYYSKRSLLGVMIFYAGLTMLGYVYLALQFQKDLFLTLPLFLIFILWFFMLTLKSSPLVKEPERIFTEPLFCIYSLVLFLSMVFLCFR